MSDKLATAVVDSAQLRKKRSELPDSDDAAAYQLNALLNDRSIEILELRLQLMEKTQQSDSQNLHDSITSLLQDLQPVLAGSDRPSELEHLWNAAFMIGVTAIAATAVGAPLAALATHQVIGQKILEDAIATFATVTLVEAADEVRDHLRNHREPIADPWAHGSTTQKPIEQPPSPVKRTSSNDRYMPEPTPTFKRTSSNDRYMPEPAPTSRSGMRTPLLVADSR